MITFQSILQNIQTQFLKPIVAIIVGLGLVFFLWGLAKYLRGGLGDQAKVKEARTMMFWGVIILAVMFSVWGLVKIVSGFFFPTETAHQLPPIPYFNRSN